MSAIGEDLGFATGGLMPVLDVTSARCAALSCIIGVAARANDAPVDAPVDAPGLMGCESAATAGLLPVA